MSTSGFVYALFDFRAGEEDEISFKTGERIDVLDKDDEYADGWWRGRNRAGDVGIFPMNHTSPYKADVPVSLRPAMSVRKHGHSGHSSLSGSSRHGRAHSADRAESSGSHARPKLVRDNTPARMSLPTMSAGRPGTPAGLGIGNGTDTGTLIPVQTPPLVYSHPHSSPSLAQSTGMHTPLSPSTPKSPSTMTLASLPLSSSSTTGGEFPSDFMVASPLSPSSASTITSPMRAIPQPIPIPISQTISMQLPLPSPPFIPLPQMQPQPQPQSQQLRASSSVHSLHTAHGVPTPPGLSPALPITPPHLSPARLPDPPREPSYDPHPLPPTPSHDSPTCSNPQPLHPCASEEEEDEELINHPGIPSSWTTDYVVSHLSRRGFDSAIQAAFLTHDISGDVFLGLDIRVMKEELGIVAYGKRVRLTKLVGELRRLEEEAEETREREREERRVGVLREEADAREREREEGRGRGVQRAATLSTLGGSAAGEGGERASVMLVEGPPPYTLGALG